MGPVVLSNKVGLSVPSVEGYVDNGSLEVQDDALVFRGRKRLPELVMKPVTSVWTADHKVHVRFGIGQVVGLLDLSQGAFKAAKRTEAFAQEIRSAMGLAETEPPSEAERAAYAAEAAVSRGHNKLQTARTWMGFGGVLLAIGLAWLALADDPPGYAWTFVVIGGLRLVAALFERREGKRMASGEWTPPSESQVERNKQYALAFISVLSLATVALITHAIAGEWIFPALGIAAALVLLAIPTAVATSMVRATRNRRRSQMAAAPEGEGAPVDEAPSAPATLGKDAVSVAAATPVEPEPRFEPHVVVRDAPPPEPPVPQAPPTPAAEQQAPPSRNPLWTRTGLIVSLAVVGAAIALGAGGLLLIRALDRAPDDPSQSATSRGDAKVPVAVQSPAAPDPTPEATVQALYEAASSGDLDAARATFETGFVLEPGMLEAWGQTQCIIGLVSPGTQPGEVKVEVDETSGGGMSGDIVTWTLREGPSGWRICGWFLGPIEMDPSLGALPQSTPGGYPDLDQAMNTVGLFLQSIMVGDMSSARSLATDDLESSRPGLFEYEYGAFTSFTTMGAMEDGDGYLVDVQEVRTSGSATRTYRVVNEGGTFLVDEQR